MLTEKITKTRNHLLQELGNDFMQTPSGTLPEHIQQEVLWHMQANNFAGAKRLRDTYERQQRIKASCVKLQGDVCNVGCK